MRVVANIRGVLKLTAKFILLPFTNAMIPAGTVNGRLRSQYLLESSPF